MTARPLELRDKSAPATVADPCGYGGQAGRPLLYPLRPADVEASTHWTGVVLHLEARIAGETDVGLSFRRVSHT